MNNTGSTGQSADPRWFNLAEEDTKPKTISEIKQIKNGEGLIVPRSELKDIVEEPCLKACELLYDKNIRTEASGANGQNWGDDAFIAIGYESLSDENKAIAEKLIEENEADPLSTHHGSKDTARLLIHTPIAKSSTVQEVSDKLVAIASKFKEQDVLFGRKDYDELCDNVEEFVELLRRFYGVKDASSEELGEWAEDIYGKYDKESNSFWKNEELLEKHRKYIAEHPQE